MKISYGITVYNETDELNRLLEILIHKTDEEDEIVILYDAKNGDEAIEFYCNGYDGQVPEVIKEKMGMIQVDDSQYLLKEWIKFQYKELKENVATHKRIIERLRRKGLDQHFPELQEDF